MMTYSDSNFKWQTWRARYENQIGVKLHSLNVESGGSKNQRNDLRSATLHTASSTLESKSGLLKFIIVSLNSSQCPAIKYYNVEDSSSEMNCCCLLVKLLAFKSHRDRSTETSFLACCPLLIGHGAIDFPFPTSNSSTHQSRTLSNLSVLLTVVVINVLQLAWKIVHKGVWSLLHYYVRHCRAEILHIMDKVAVFI
eukprot:6183357-Pleurochrysis_carterae.AAC.1